MPPASRINESVRALVAVGTAVLLAVALFVPSVSERFNTAVQWRPVRPLFPPGQIRLGHFTDSASEGGQGKASEPRISLDWMNEDQLTEAITWWHFSQRIDDPPGPPLYPLPDRECYITWEPDTDGLNNIRLQMETLVMLAHLTGRTLVLPDHLAGPIKHMSSPQPPVDLWDFYDLEHLRQWIPTMPMLQYLDKRKVGDNDTVRTDTDALREYLRNGSLHEETVYPQWSAMWHVLAPGGDGTNETDPTSMHPRLDEWRLHHADPNNNQVCKLRVSMRPEVFYGDEERRALTLHFVSNGQTRLFGSPAFIYFPTAAWLDYYWAKVRDYLHFHLARLREAARVLIRVAQETGGRFDAVHVRSTDWAADHRDWYVEPERLAPKALQVFGNGTALYIATDDANRATWEPMIRAFPKECLFFDNPSDSPEIVNDAVILMSDVVSEAEVPLNSRGVVDQIVCSVARRFMGSFGSTFSAYIYRMRSYHSMALVPDKGVYFINYPYTQEEYDSVVNNNTWQAEATWWGRPGVEHFARDLWMRDFVTTTGFSTQRLPPSLAPALKAVSSRRHLRAATGSQYPDGQYPDVGEWYEVPRVQRRGSPLRDRRGGRRRRVWSGSGSSSSNRAGLLVAEARRGLPAAD